MTELRGVSLDTEECGWGDMTIVTVDSRSGSTGKWHKTSCAVFHGSPFVNGILNNAKQLS